MSYWKNEDEYQDYRLRNWRDRQEEMLKEQRQRRKIICIGCGELIDEKNDHHMLVCKACAHEKT